VEQQVLRQGGGGGAPDGEEVVAEGRLREQAVVNHHDHRRDAAHGIEHGQALGLAAPDDIQSLPGALVPGAWVGPAW